MTKYLNETELRLLEDLCTCKAKAHTKENHVNTILKNDIDKKKGKPVSIQVSQTLRTQNLATMVMYFDNW